MTRRSVVSALAALTLVGCSGGHGGGYAVTVVEAADVDCQGDRRSAAVPESLVKSTVQGIEQAAKSAFQLEPPRPEGHVLRVVEGEDEMRAWFEEAPAQQNGTPSPLSPTEVYVGIPHDDSIEGDANDVFRLNVPPPSGTGVTGDCGELLRSAGALRLTVDGGAVEGRVRRTDYVYRTVGLSACDIRVGCARSLLIDGAIEE